MQFNAASPSRLQTLATRWSLIGMALVALAREISLARKLRAHWGIAKADYLEAAFFAALVMLSGEIAKSDTPRCRVDEDALLHLQTVHAMLSVMVLLIQQLRRELSVISERWTTLSFQRTLTQSKLPSHPQYARGFLDSS